MSTAFWLSSAVENTSLRRTGIVVLRSMILVITPPRVSTPSESGVTSSRSTSWTSPLSTPAWMAAPSATTSSGFTDMFGSLPPVMPRTSACTAGIRVDPPTRITSSMSSAVTLASDIACLTGSRHRSTRSAVICSNFERMIVMVRCFGPSAPAVMNGRLTWVWLDRAELDLRLLGGLEQPLQRLRVAAQVDPVVLLELVGEVVDESPVEVVAAEMGVAGGGARPPPHRHRRRAG